ncbi:MAG: hypothetical protein ACRENX_10825 [Candidatus Dormibacteria bacterium]
MRARELVKMSTRRVPDYLTDGDLEAASDGVVRTRLLMRAGAGAALD